MKKTAIICDIDGTLAIKGNRGIYEYEKAGVDTVNEPIKSLLKYLVVNEEYAPAIIICSGRMDFGKQVLLDWMEENDIPYDEVFMRETGDKRPDFIVKNEIYENKIKPNYDVLFVLDDRNSVVDMWRGIGLACLQVAPGDF